MSTLLKIGQAVSTLLGLIREDTGASLNPSIAPQLSFLSSDIAVFGVAPDSAPNTLALQLTGAGSALFTIQALCTYLDPILGKFVTEPKSKTLSVSVVRNGSNFEVTLN
jgi:hypothetical protein